MLGEQLLMRTLRKLVKRGSLRVTFSDGQTFDVGAGGAPHAAIRFRDSRSLMELLRDPELKLGELYMDGRLILEEGSVFDLLQVLLQDSRGNRRLLPGRLRRKSLSFIKRLFLRNTIHASHDNVAHHYDLRGEFFALFLDADRQYSCAYFDHPAATLEEAQTAKKRHIAAKLFIQPGMRILDIGSGWGGLALYLKEIAGAGSIKGITLSEEQLLAAQEKIRRHGCQGITFALQDYREAEGPFDRVVSVGMFEHVGLHHYGTFFDQLSRLLGDEGIALLHTIGRTGPPDHTNPFITKYIFPGGHLPTLSEIIPLIEKSGLILTDVEILRLHYAETLRHWRMRFQANRHAAVTLYDERFCRMWECYLAMSEAAFRFEDVVVFQLQLAKRADILPMTRDYIAENEARLKKRETL